MRHVPTLLAGTHVKQTRIHLVNAWVGTIGVQVMLFVLYQPISSVPVANVQLVITGVWIT
jgi:hypothetical protein